jgi:prepilin-type N-terminal cleavage/methylation domain-containing protein
MPTHCHSRLSRVRGFTLIELLSTIALLAVVSVIALFYVPSYISWAQNTADQRTLLVLNDALTRYKTEGGNVSALTIGAPIGHVISAMQTPVTWAGMTQQFIQTGVTYPGRSLQATGNGAQYHFVQYNSYTDPALVPGTPTNRNYYGAGVGYMANQSAQAYTINITASSGFYAVQLAGGAKTVYASGSHNFGAADSITFWACVGPAGADTGTNSLPSGNITGVVCGSQQLTSLDLSGIGSSLTTLGITPNPLTSINISGCSGLTGQLWWSYGANITAQLTSLKVAGCSGITALGCDGHNLTSINLSGCTALTAFYCSSNQLTSIDISSCPNLAIFSCDHNQISALDVSGHALITSLGITPNPLTSVNLSGCTGLTGFISINYPSGTTTPLTYLNVSGCAGITGLGCQDNSLLSLNASGCTALTSIYGRNNQFGNINITGDHALPASSTNSSTTFQVQGNPSVTITGP